MAQKPSIPKGTRDFSPAEIAKRDYIFDIVKKHFKTFGFQPIETPSFENSDTLMGKYGDEGDRLIFKILNSGNYITDSDKIIEFGNIVNKGISYKLFESFYVGFIKEAEILFIDKNIIPGKFSDFQLEKIKSYLNSHLKRYVFFNPKFKNSEKDERLIKEILDLQFDLFLKWTNDIVLKMVTMGGNRLYWKQKFVDGKNSFINSFYSRLLSKRISEKALRYDLTVPFARYVVQHQNEIDFPFKRYQIQPVWRADRPQKGRFREFYQCDADVVGANSLLQEVELVQLYDVVFTSLKLEGVTIKINNRKILAGIAEVIGAQRNLVNFTVALDKLDKIGEEGVKKEMLAKGISENSIAKAAPLFNLTGSSREQLQALKNLLANSDQGIEGVEEVEFIVNSINDLGLKSAKIALDVTLARGLNYYTGAIFEVAAPEGIKMGSIGGGGRYDDLTGIFGLKNVSGVGISFGLDRIYLVMEELNLFPETLDKSLDVLCMNFGEKESIASLKLVNELRSQGILADVYPSKTKMQKQMKYANNRNVPYVVLIGEQELTNNSFVVKNMKNSEQITYSLDSIQDFAKTL
ncbi:histidine--tRNA ligase [Maribacter sp. HTCC2170]|uniref:histidine--tRNA ligase n=1 Tax=Maribacter sp. (strain HTCC2170 / KCCM 42371) TaxID=313603 RepID=UPI00006B4789|nr:histidine--tRNA ligase [Maribacter sp. HTCC2170]EAR01564.1 histidyl-tRNA synthetase [Maribacter sp. HTCC2170]